MANLLPSVFYPCRAPLHPQKNTLDGMLAPCPIRIAPRFLYTPMQGAGGLTRGPLLRAIAPVPNEKPQQGFLLGCDNRISRQFRLREATSPLVVVRSQETTTQGLLLSVTLPTTP